MFNYKLTLQYDGGRYKGWQKLGNSENTIQEKFSRAVSEYTKEETEVIGCSRTDAGVHALGQVANVKLKRQAEPKELMDYLNHYLPQDIRVIGVEAVPESFHARYQAKGKTYLYQIWNRDYPNPFRRKYSMHVPEPLNIKAMERGAAYFIGTHDFTGFSNAKTTKKSMVRSIYSMDISTEEGMIGIRISGDGFLYHMVRKMVGVLIEIGLGRLSAELVPELLEAKDRSRIKVLAEACGLFLEKVEY